jgi:hypothetical protein
MEATVYFLFSSLITKVFLLESYKGGAKKLAELLMKSHYTFIN